MNARWRKGCGYFSKADANKVANEVLEIGEEATTQQIVDKARDSNTELHKCFTWDDNEAAERYRRVEARQLMSMLVIVRNDVPREETAEPLPEVRVFHKTSRSPEVGYKPLEVIVKHQDEYEALLGQAMRDMRSFTEKYKILSELDELIELMESYLTV